MAFDVLKDTCLIRLVEPKMSGFEAISRAVKDSCRLRFTMKIDASLWNFS